MKIGNITIDEPTKSIITGRKFIFFGKRRIIPFSDVVQVRVAERAATHYDIDGGRPRDLVTVIYYDTVIVFLGHKKRRHEVLRISGFKSWKEADYLADEIKKYIGI